MLLLEGDVPAQRFKDPSDHEAERFGVDDRAAVSDGKQSIRQIPGGAFILDMLGVQAAYRSCPRRLIGTAVSNAGKRYPSS
ncbi:hypothetical protein [Mesorhizobium sp. WSM4884]|uniref:hypothetical protein n=1 Tax=Mesorhizobium sp. WSM4884 TaxID=3038542 RepID=UPI0024172DFB|nr:hypothetical protein [Mesorhizobium sp. WSM4884]MDG4884496.1 hypothetical protein [Mesorhizobium sp. WSM4884]